MESSSRLAVAKRLQIIKKEVKGPANCGCLAALLGGNDGVAVRASSPRQVMVQGANRVHQRLQIILCTSAGQSRREFGSA